MSFFTMDTASPITIDQTTVFSFLAVLVLLIAAYAVSVAALSRSTPGRLRFLFIWHLFDALIHFFFEGSFLYQVFFSHVPFDSAVHHPASIINFLGHSDRVHGAKYGIGATASLWQEYAKADKRWGEVDITVVSLELLTVFVGGPLAVWICWMIARRDPRVNIWMIILATGELYGGRRMKWKKRMRRDSMTDLPRLHDVLPRMANG
jgi:hypothetical protein